MTKDELTKDLEQLTAQAQAVAGAIQYVQAKLKQLAAAESQQEANDGS